MPALALVDVEASDSADDEDGEGSTEAVEALDDGVALAAAVVVVAAAVASEDDCDRACADLSNEDEMMLGAT